MAKLDLSVKRWTFKSVSSDNIRRQVMDELIANKKLGKEKAFTQSRKQANKRYQDAIVRILSDCSKLKSGEGCVVFLDKNHPADAVRYVVETVDTYIPDNVAHLKIYLAPEHSKLKPLPGFPYSQAFMAQVLTNAALRTNHPTLDNSDPANAFAVCLMFLGLNRGTRFDAKFLSSNGLDDFMSLPIVAESPARQNDFEFATYLKAVLTDAGPKNNFTVASKHMPDLVNFVYKYANEWQAFPSAE